MNVAILKRNPELARNLQLELSTQRMVVMPVILFLLAALILSTSQINSYMRENEYDYLAKYSSIAFMLITALWGAKSASDGMIEEYNGRTWDWQRMSTLTPWKMTIGKLFGSTIYNWYGGAICLFIYLMASISSATIQSAKTVTEAIPPTTTLLLSFIHIINSIFIAIAAQGLAILFALMEMRKGDGRSKIKSSFRIIPFIIVLSILGSTSSLFRTWGIYGNENEYWYGINFGYFRDLFTTLFYASWIVAGVYRTMRTELQYTNGLKWWLIFLKTTAIFNAGFFIGQHNEIPLNLSLALAASVVFITFAIITFLMTLLEPKEIVNFRSVLKYYKEKNYAKLYTVIPLWTVTIIYVIISGILCSILIFNIHDGAISDKYNDFFSNGNYLLRQFKGEITMAAMMPFALIGFMLRDVAIILFVNLLGRNKRADATAMLYLVILYLIIPFIIRSESIGFLFYPNSHAGTIAMVVAPFCEAAIAIYFLTQRWKEINRKIAE